MVAHDARWDGIETRYRKRMNDSLSFEKELRVIASKLEKFHDNILANDLYKYCEYLEYLVDVVEFGDSFHVLGLEIFLDELDNIFPNGIDELKSVLNKYLEDQNEANYDSVDKIIHSCHSKFHELSFIEIKNMKIRSVAGSFTTGFHAEISDELVNELYKYLDTGVALMNDEITHQYLEQVKNLHLEAKTTAAYSAIIGTSLMGKTQVAFTLSNFINVIYLNCRAINIKSAFNFQKIDALFIGIFEIFRYAFVQDDCYLRGRDFDISAEQIVSCEASFCTLGLIYMILRTRKIREAEVTSGQSFSVKDWLLEIVSTKEVVFPSWNIDQFREKTRGNYKNFNL